MNREIKFRGKQVDNGEWVYGYYVIDPLKRHRVYYQPFDESSNNTYQFVIPETVCQYTGLKDKNGKEIYEGDMFQVALNKVYTIKFLDGTSNHEWYGGMFGLWFNEELFFPFDEYAIEHGVVIGNVFENPELLNH